MRILLVTDSHLAEAATALVSNWHAAAAYAERAAIDLTIHLGDISFDAIVKPPQLAEAKRLVDAWPTPMRLIPGNHDIGDNPGTIGVPPREWLDDASYARYAEVFGADRWAIRESGWSLIAINAQLMDSGRREEADQWDWLAAELERARGGPTIVFLHKPLFENPDTDSDHHARYVPRAGCDRLMGMIAGLDVRMIVCGHAHQYLDRTIAGIRHVWIPSCAFVIPDRHQQRFGEKIVGVGVLELAADCCRLDIVAAEGLVPHDITRVRRTMLL